MKSILKISHLIFFSFFAQTNFAQHIELLSSDAIKITSNTFITHKGGVYSVRELGIQYVSSLEKDGTSLQKDILFKKVDFKLVNWVNKDRSWLNWMKCKLDGENLTLLTLIEENKTLKKYLIEYTFNPNLELVNERIIQEITVERKGSGRWDYENIESNNTLIVYFKEEGENSKGADSYIQHMECYLINNNFKVEHHLILSFEAPIDKRAGYYTPRGIKNSLQLLENNTATLIMLGKLYMLDLENESISPLEFDVKGTIYAHKIYGGKNGEFTLIGGYKKDNEFGMAVLQVNPKKDIIDENYFPFDQDFSKEFHVLVNARFNNEGKTNENEFQFGDFEPILVDAKIDEDGSIKAVFMGVAKGKDKYQLWFRNNLVIIGVKKDDVIFQEVIPYIYKGAYIPNGNKSYTFDGVKTKVYFYEDNITVIYRDYNQNYDNNFYFMPTTDKIPSHVKASYVAKQLYFNTNKSSHRLLEVRTTGNIKYKPKSSNLIFTNIVLPDKSILMGCSEGRGTSIIGKLILQ